MPKDLPYWLQSTIFTGREEGDEGEGNEGDEGDNAEDDDSESGEGEGGEGDQNSDDSDVEGLKKALAEERRRANKAEREAKRLKRRMPKEDDPAAKEEQKNLEAAQAEVEASNKKVAKLAEGFRNRERDAAILAEARKQGFIDPTDALTDDIRNAVDIDQDDEDPSDIDIDPKSVSDAVKGLANKKKHLVGKPNGGAPSGSRLRKDQSSDDGASEQKLVDLYPSLG